MNEIKYMYKKVVKFDIYICILFLVVSVVFLRQYTIPLITGLLAATLNFVVSGHFVQATMNEGKRGFFITTVTVSRVLFVCLLGILFYKYYKYYLIAYLIGFVSHFIAIILYGIFSMNEGK